MSIHGLLTIYIQHPDSHKKSKFAVFCQLTNPVLQLLVFLNETHILHQNILLFNNKCILNLVFNFRKRKAEEDEVEKEQKKMSEEWNKNFEVH